MSILDRILETKRREVEERKSSRPFDEVASDASSAAPARSFAASLARTGQGFRVIAEVKKA